MTDVTIVLPAVSDDAVSAGLRELTEAIARRNPDRLASGILGGEFGYGCDHVSDVFEMHPFYWGDCECGFDGREWDWCNTHDHEDHCYQKEIRRRGYSDDFGGDYKSRERRNREATDAVCAEMGLDPVYGSAVHCTCAYRPAWEAWRSENDHDPSCGIVAPNFKHFPSGFEVRWYKYIGRDMEFVNEPSSREWRRILDECLESI